MLWIIILGTTLLVFIIGLIYLLTRFNKFSIIKKLTKGRKLLKIFLPLLITATVVATLSFTLSVINAVVCIIHLVLVWIIFDIIFFIIENIRKKEFKKYYSGICAIVFTFCYLCAGFYLANNVWKTEYNITTDKPLGNLKIAQFADSHIGTTFSGKEFEKYVNEIQSENPDIVFITGDFVDDGTSKQDMLDACEALSNFKVKYGVYYVFGNHDKGYFSESERGWNFDDLKENLTLNGVTVLEDETVLIDDRFYVIGRVDRAEEQISGEIRTGAEVLVSTIDREKYIIMLDHQPYDYDNQKQAKVDLVLSGHTHGGQLIPINHVGELIGENCLYYGYEKRGNTDFIVTSGISDWELLFKTGCKSEYVIINVEGK